MNLEKGMLIDLGGGSTEIVHFDDVNINEAYSIPLGSLSLFRTYASELCQKTRERKRMVHAVRDRLHTILPGMVIMRTIMKTFDAKRVIVSTTGVREGYLLKKIIGQEFLNSYCSENTDTEFEFTNDMEPEFTNDLHFDQLIRG